jgi:flavin reductase (DIM6/NTAB) family NADH-FMN oxidoreductase RutF
VSGTATAIDPETFRHVMASFPAGVAVVTTVDGEGRPYGLTTTAVTSVSADPPLLLVCIDRSSRTLPFLRRAGRFAVNILESRHAAVAHRFASKDDEKFAGLSWTQTRDGSPVLHEHSSAWAELRLRQEIEAGDHVVLIGEVTAGDVSLDGGGGSLVYFRRRFGNWTALEL